MIERGVAPKALEGRRVAMVAVTLLATCATESAAQCFSVGGRFGVGVSNPIFQDDINDGRMEPRSGPLFGGLVSYGLSRYLGFRFEAQVSQKGWEEYGDGGGRRFTYLDLPLLIDARLPTSFSPHLFAGPFVGFELSCSVTGVPSAGSVGCDDSRVGLQREKVDYGATFGLGVGHGLGAGRLYLDLMGTFGFRDLNREPHPPGYQRLGLVSLTAGYSIPLGRPQ